MRHLITILLLLGTLFTNAQPTGYYNGTEGKTGEELKAELNNIISGHMEWAYFYASNIFMQSDADPETSGNVITVYKGSSVDGTNYGTGGDYLNREHVWAKSHGQFGTDLPAGGDAHNLKPADGSVNISRSNKDFDNCQENGQQHDEATGCYYTDDAWEPRDEVKGDIARIIFYMATRYEGENDEVDLEVNDQVDNSPDPFHGRLSALMEWNEQDPPDDFERNRNNVIFGYQQNRNPFIDNPQWVNMIWDNAPANSIAIGEVSQSQELIFTGDAIVISATITGTGDVSATLNWGTTYDNQPNSISMSSEGENYTAQIPAQTDETDIYYTIEATDDNGTHSTVIYNYHVEAQFNGTIMSITDVQGEQAATPYDGEEVTVSGVVTANFGEGFFIQDDAAEWSGIYVYDVINPVIGDSVVLTGTVTEYYDLTEIAEVTDYYLISRDNDLPAPIIIDAGDAGEAYESVLVRVEDATCVDAGGDWDDYGMWELSDETGNIFVHNNQVYEFYPYVNEIYTVVGPLKYDYSEWKIEIRMPSDVSGETDDIAPVIDDVEVINDSSVKLYFSEYLNTTSAETTSNYVISDNIAVHEAVANIFSPDMVTLSTDPMENGTYDLTVSNIKDEAGNVMETQTVTFSIGNSVADAVEENCHIYPNPAQSQVVVQRLDNIAQIYLTDASGRIWHQRDVGNNQTRAVISGLAKGIYFVHLTNADGMHKVQKLIVK